MRLSEIRKTISQQLPILSTLKITTPSSAANQRIITNIIPVADAIDTLSSIECLSANINALKSCTDIFNVRMNSFTVDHTFASNFQKELTTLINKCDTILSLIDSVQSPLPENRISVKLSPDITNTNDLKDIISDLHKIFTSLCASQDDVGSIRFVGVESGSDWINFGIEGIVLGGLVYKAVQLAYLIAKDRKTHQLLDERYHGAVTQNQINDLALAMAKEIVPNNLSELTPEAQTKTIAAVASLAEIINKGNTVIAQLTEPEAAKPKTNTESIEEFKKAVALLQAPTKS